MARTRATGTPRTDSLDLPLLRWLCRNGPLEIAMLRREYESLAGSIPDHEPFTHQLCALGGGTAVEFHRGELDFRGDPIILVSFRGPAPGPAK